MTAHFSWNQRKARAHRPRLQQGDRIMKRKFWTALSLLSVLMFLGVAPLVAQSNPVYVPLPAGAKALFYKPDNNPNARIAVLSVHRTGNKFGSIECTELSRRGIA